MGSRKCIQLFAKEDREIKYLKANTILINKRKFFWIILYIIKNKQTTFFTHITHNLKINYQKSFKNKVIIDIPLYLHYHI